MADTVKKLKEPKLCGRAQCRAGMAGAGTANLQICEGVVRPLLEAEHADRGVRSIRYQPRPARFPVHRGLAIPRRTGLPAILTGRRGAVVPPAVQALREHRRDRHGRPGLRRMARRVQRCQDGHRPSGPADPPLPHHRDRQRILPLRAQPGNGKGPHPAAGKCQTRETEGGKRRTLLKPKRLPERPNPSRLVHSRMPPVRLPTPGQNSMQTGGQNSTLINNDRPWFLRLNGGGFN